MPELPEVETVRRGLERAFVGRAIRTVETRRADLRFPLPERMGERLAGHTVAAVRRRAKYLLIDLDDGQSLIVHLGMSGSFRLEWHRPLPPQGEGSAWGSKTPAIP